jgi:predicted AlkP superfamily phosphohydrolase/phosphomutase
VTGSLPEGTSIVIMSDHGCGLVESRFSVNRWLEQEGLLEVKGPLRRIGSRRGHAFPTVSQVMARGGPVGRLLGHGAPQSILGLRVPVPWRIRRSDPEVVHWPGTRAYGLFAGLPTIMLRLNLRGREPRGTVAPGREANELTERLKERLCAVTHPVTGERIVDRVLDRDEIYHGPATDRMPDLVGLFRDWKCVASGSLSERRVLTPHKKGAHRMNGILVIAGADAARGEKLPMCEIVDVAPTILHLLGLPIPSDMDGTVLEGALSEELGARGPVRVCPPRGPRPEGSADGETGRDPSSERNVMGLLEALGYLG